ncbi:dihydropteroate synthase [Nonomuraea recticatena]|uniref:dihydropteroate synthase n=1 Tax=Nonomuraea recticatena TaxID=46178 RepID=UPI0031F93595
MSILRLHGREFGPGEYAVMAVVNRTPDSFFDRGRTYGFGAALEAVAQAVEGGADIVDIGGVKAGPGETVDAHEEIRRVADLVSAVRERHPELIISVDTWRAEVGDVVAKAGADLLNDTWGGVDPGLAEVAARHGVGLVCAHAGRVEPRTRPHRIAYADVVADVVSYTVELAGRAVAAGVARESILIDPAHDFGKNTFHSLEVSRRLDEMTATGWPVLVAVSNKDFVGEALGGLPVEERHAGTIATLAVSALQGARVFRVHDAASARTALAEVARLTRPGA